MSEKATDKQIGMLVYTIRSEFPEALVSHEDASGNEMKYNDLKLFVGEHLDKYQVSSLINVISDQDLKDEWKQDFLVDYLRAKGFEGV